MNKHTIQIVLFLSLWLTNVIALDNNPDQDSSNIVAAVVGYQTERELKDGTKIPCFSYDKSKGDGSEKGVLFYVVKPKYFEGKYFWMHYDGKYSDAPPTAQLYKSENLYYFTYNEDLNDRWAIHTNNFLNINPKGFSLCSLRPLGHRYYSIVKDAEESINNLRERKKYNAEQVKVLSAELVNINKKKNIKEWRQKDYELQIHKGNIDVIESNIKEAYRQIEILKKKEN